MPDEDGRNSLLLRHPQEPPGRLSHLTDRSGCRPELGRVERLDGVDHAHVGTLLLERGADGIQLRLGQDLDLLRAAEPIGPKLDLCDRLLSRDEQATPARSGDVAERCQEQRRLADTRLATDEHERSGHEATAEDAVELGHARVDPGRLLGTHIDEPFRRRGRTPPRRLRGRLLARELLDERAESAAAGALSEPPARRRAALGADVLDDHLGHDTDGTRTIGRHVVIMDNEGVSADGADRPADRGRSGLRRGA